MNVFRGTQAAARRLPGMGPQALAMVVTLALIAHGCAAAPSTSPATDEHPSGSPIAVAIPTVTPSDALASDPPSLAPTVEPTAAPTSVPTRDPSVPASPITWERVVDRGLPIGGVSDGDGWIVVGTDGRIWRSLDGRTWTVANVENADRVWLSGVTRRGNSFFAGGVRCEPEDGLARSTGIFWRSGDGLDWRQVGSIDLGRQYDECAEIEHLVATGSGLVATLEGAKAISSGAISSDDGTRWTEISKEAFNLAPDPNSLGTTAFAALNDRETLLLATCRECAVGIWSTTDGLTWTELGSLGEDSAVGFEYVVGLSPAVGDRVVVAAWVCDVQPCHTSIWIRNDDGSFERVRDDFLLDFPQLTFTGREYLLVGSDSTDLSVSRLHAFVSRDGISWREIDTMAHEECHPRGLIGGDSAALFLGEHDCRGIWRFEAQP